MVNQRFLVKHVRVCGAVESYFV